MHALRLVLLGIAIGVAMIFGVRFALYPPAQAPIAQAPTHLVNLSPEVARETVEKQIGASREYARFFQTARQEFPAEYERIVAEFSQRAQSALALSPDLYLAEALRGLRVSHGVMASRASVAALEKVFEHQEKIVTTLAQTSPQLCADFLYGNAAPGFFQFSARHRALIGAMAEASLEAMIDGRTVNIERAPPADEDFAALESELGKKGLGRPEIEALLDGKTPEPPLSDDAMCRAGKIYFETLRALPAEARLKIYALAIKLLARS